MAKINSMMDVGKRSMMNSQTALQTVAHNIANKSTEGYTSQASPPDIAWQTAEAKVPGIIMTHDGVVTIPYP